MYRINHPQIKAPGDRCRRGLFCLPWKELSRNYHIAVCSQCECPGLTYHFGAAILAQPGTVNVPYFGRSAAHVRHGLPVSGQGKMRRRCGSTNRVTGDQALAKACARPGRLRALPGRPLFGWRRFRRRYSDKYGRGQALQANV
jgi:hypothetical protein